MNNGNSKISGATYIAASALFYGSYGVWSRLMSGSFGEFSQAWTRGLFLLVVVLLINSVAKLFKKIEKKDFIWFLIIALAGGLNQAPYFFGFEHLSIGTATILFYASLVVGGYILGVIVFKERLGWIKLVSLVLSIIGMVVIYGFTLRINQMLPAILVIIAGFLGTCTVVLPKKLVGNYHELQIMSGYFVMQIFINLPLSIIFQNNVPTLGINTAWGAQLGYATAMLVANFSAIIGFSKLEASIGSLIGLLEIIFGTIFGILFFKEALTFGVLAGGGTILLAAGLPSISELLENRKLPYKIKESGL